jgi:putative thioredoxin
LTVSENVRDIDGFSFNAQVLDGSRERLVMVDFWAAWCGPCRTLTPILTRVVDELDGQVLLAKIDVDREPALASRYGIRSLPTVMLFRDGAPIDQFMGALPEGEVKRFLAPHVGPRQPDVLAEADALAGSGDLSGAIDRLTQALAADPAQTRLLGPLADYETQAGELASAAARLEQVPIADLDARCELARSRLRLHQEAEAARTLEPTGVAAAYRDALSAFTAGRVEAAIDGLLAVVAEDRTFRDDAARKALLDVFTLLGDSDPRVKASRSRLSSVLMR